LRREGEKGGERGGRGGGRGKRGEKKGVRGKEEEKRECREEGGRIRRGKSIKTWEGGKRVGGGVGGRGEEG